MTFMNHAPTFSPALATSRQAPRDPAGAGLSQMPLLGLDIVNATTAEVVDHLLNPGRRFRVAFLNAHCGNVMAKDAGYADALRTADMVLPDGIGVELAARFCGKTFRENLNGTDFTPALLRAAAARGQSVYLLGARPGVAEEAARRLCLAIPGLRIVGTRDGYAGMADEEAAIAAINAVAPDIVIAALGVPMQDLWLARNADRLNARLTLGVGALLDFLSGRVRRAPLWLRKARAEWIWRLVSEPRRMARRYLSGNFAFLGRAAVHALRQADAYVLRRRTLDVAVAAATIVLLAPLTLVLAAAIRLESAGPVLFRQTRIGLDGAPFTILKFRSMYADAEQCRAALLATSDREGICFKSRTDPRVTRVGRIMRRFSLDELPQLINVLRGEMSVVGPRPALPDEVAAYPAHALGRLAVKPGLTGVWQVSGRAEIGFDRMVEMDLAYARARSTGMDLLIMLRTFRAVFGGRGAY